MSSSYGQAIPKWIYRLANVALRNPSVISGDYRYLFIMSHMRCYTTVLSHILGSHPEISGYFELHQSYRNSFDLFLMRVRVANGVNYRVHGPYLLDKVLHSQWSFSPEILKRKDVFTIFTLREPEGSLKSLMHQRKKRGFPADVLAYYLDRLNWLGEMSSLPLHRIYVDGESIVNEPQAALESIRSYLHLKAAISPSYSTFKFTGEKGFGDWTDYIRQGKIVKERDLHSEYQIAPDDLETARKAYDETRRILRENCRSI